MEKDIKDPTQESTPETEKDTVNTANQTSADTPSQEEAPDTPEAQIAKLYAQIEELKKQQLYKAAEFDNFRKRVMQEKAELIKNGGTKAITTLLPIIDDLERAQENQDQ